MLKDSLEYEDTGGERSIGTLTHVPSGTGVWATQHMTGLQVRLFMTAFTKTLISLESSTNRTF